MKRVKKRNRESLKERRSKFEESNLENKKLSSNAGILGLIDRRYKEIEEKDASLEYASKMDLAKNKEHANPYG